MVKMKWAKAGLVVLLVAVLTLGYGGVCRKSNNEDTVTGSSGAVEEHPLGLKLLTAQDYKSLPAAVPPMGVGGLPAECDNSGNMPTPGLQKYNDCVAWACAYEFKTYQEKVKRGWSISQSDTNHLFSPAFIYNQINFGRNGGTYFCDAINILTSQGCATLATMPYDTSDYLTQPSAAARAEAAQYKAVYDGTVDPNNITLVKQYLASGSVMPIAISVWSNFYYRANIKSTNYIYKSFGDTYFGGHGVTLVGYSDSKSAFKIINSWGTDWGDMGYAWIDYGFFPTACWEVYHFKDMVATETVSTPNRPSGPASGTTGVSYSYSTDGASSNLGHAVEYQFDWKGDGTNLSTWGAATQSNTWTTAASYSVKARARCTVDTTISSTWSAGFDVIISAAPPAETISTPNQPTGAISGNTGISYTYSTGGASSNLGHSLEYRFDWGDTTYSTWSSSTTASKTWFFTNTYTVKSQARCAADTSIVSAWSPGLSVTITMTMTAQVTSPTPANSATNVITTTSLSWAAASGATSYDVYFGTSSPGVFIGNQAGTTYNPGTLNPGAVYYWRIDSKNSVGTTTGNVWSFATQAPPPPETISTPNQPTGATSGNTGASYTYSTGGSSSSLGHSLEYRFDWGDITYSTWSSSNTASKIWLSAGTYTIKSQARCAADTSIVSAWSSGLSVTISSPVMFSYTGGQQTWVVPAGVTSIQVDTKGAQGGRGAYYIGGPSAGGNGARVQTTLSVTPGETLYIYIGGAGSYVYGTCSPAGWNGGGLGGWDSVTGGGGSGGGASDIRQGGTALSNRVVVAGGGGAGGSYNFAIGGASGYNGSAGGVDQGGGGGGTQTAGGTGGGASGQTYGGTGNSGAGGSGYGGGGGGGGLYGGGGGYSYGGGGGSSYSAGSGTTYTSGYQSGNGQIIITY